MRFNAVCIEEMLGAEIKDDVAGPCAIIVAVMENKAMGGTAILRTGDKAIVLQYWTGTDISYRVVSVNGVLRDVAQQGVKHVSRCEIERFLS